MWTGHEKLRDCHGKDILPMQGAASPSSSVAAAVVYEPGLGKMGKEGPTRVPTQVLKVFKRS